MADPTLVNIGLPVIQLAGNLAYTELIFDIWIAQRILYFESLWNFTEWSQLDVSFSEIQYKAIRKCSGVIDPIVEETETSISYFIRKFYFNLLSILTHFICVNVWKFLRAKIKIWGSRRDNPKFLGCLGSDCRKHLVWTLTLAQIFFYKK